MLDPGQGMELSMIKLKINNKIIELQRNVVSIKFDRRKRDKLSSHTLVDVG